MGRSGAGEEERGYFEVRQLLGCGQMQLESIAGVQRKAALAAAYLFMHAPSNKTDSN
jgi:hypothetical protein